MGFGLPNIGIGGTPFGNIGGDFFGGSKGKSLKQLLQEMERKQNMAFQRSQSFQLMGLDRLLGGYDKAISGVKRTGSASKLDAISSGQQAQAQVEQNTVDRGLSNTTFAAQIPAVSQGATQRTLAAIDSSVAEATASLEAARGNAANMAYGGLSALSQSYAGQQMQPLQLAFQQVAAQPTQYEQLLQLMGAAGSMYGMSQGMSAGGRGGPPGAGEHNFFY